MARPHIPETPYLTKIVTLPAAQATIRRLKADARRVVFTNGCFDLLHPGHTRYLSEARRLGDHLLVAVNSDESVRALKGPNRPILPQDVRAELLAALASVDQVVIFDDPTPFQLIQALLPDILVKGGDWAEDAIVGADIVRADGGRVVRIPFQTGFSTTSLIEEILRRHMPQEK